MIVQGSQVKYTDSQIISDYKYLHTTAKPNADGVYVCTPQETTYTFKTDRKKPKLGVMLVGMGGNNGTTFTAGILANKHKIQWHNKRGLQTPNFYGSCTQASTTKIGVNGKEEVFLPLNQILPLAEPTEIVLSGWDISNMNMGDSLVRASVVDYDLTQKLYPEMSKIVPLPAVYYPDYIASNQSDRVSNIKKGNNKWDHLMEVRADIKKFKEDNHVDKVIVLWTANTERYSQITPGVHDSADNLIKAIKDSHPEISASTIYAAATIMEGFSFINGSPQNTLVPGIIQLAKQHGVFVIGDDFKTGQTKIKTCLAEFLVSAGIKPQSIVSYNHLGNNDGKNLSAEKCFRSKELSKKSCVDDILASNKVLYPQSHHIDHEIVIKYVPYTGDTKKAMDEYCSEIFLGGHHTLVLYNVCEDSLLAAPIILDLILLTELFERIQYKTTEMKDFKKFNNVLTTLGYLVKAPLTEEDHPLINSLSRQKHGLDNMFKACAGLHCDDNLLLEFRCPSIKDYVEPKK